MSRKARDITDAELAVLQQLWEKETSTVKELTEILYPTNTGSDQATVQKLLKRLEAKGCVKCIRNTWPYQYQSTMDRDELLCRRLLLNTEQLGYQSVVELLASSLRCSQLSSSDYHSLQTTLKALEKQHRN